MAILPTPPSGVPLLNPITQSVDILWQNYFNSLASITGGFAPLDARYWVSTSNSDLTNETNLGSLSSGYLKITTGAGVATPSTVTAIPATDISGTLGLAHGGTASDLSATGGANQVLQQTSSGAAITVGTLSGGTITGAALTKTDDTNVTLTLGGTPTTALLRAASLTLGWTGMLSVARGGSGAGTFTAHGVLLGEGTSAFGATGAGTSGQVLTSNGAAADPTFQAAATGTVTSVAASVPGGFSISGSPITSSGTLAIAANGTSGGVLAYTASNVAASSGALAAGAVVYGGGAGVVPTTTPNGGFKVSAPTLTQNSIEAMRPTTYQANPGNPTGTTSGGAFVMMGLASSYQTQTSGNIFAIASFYGTNTSASGGIAVQMTFGAGTAPINGAALTGTKIGTTTLVATTPGTYAPMTISGIVTGLTPNTANWFDLAIIVQSGVGTASVGNISISIFELG